MVARVNTVAFLGMEVITVDVQVQIASGLRAKPGKDSAAVAAWVLPFDAGSDSIAAHGRGDSCHSSI